MYRALQFLRYKYYTLVVGSSTVKLRSQKYKFAWRVIRNLSKMIISGGTPCIYESSCARILSWATARAKDSRPLTFRGCVTARGFSRGRRVAWSRDETARYSEFPLRNRNYVESSPFQVRHAFDRLKKVPPPRKIPRLLACILQNCTNIARSARTSMENGSRANEKELMKNK